MIYLFDKDEKLFKIINKPALKTVLQKYALTTEQYVSDRLTVEMKSLDTDELEKVEYMAIQTIEDAHTFHYFYVAQKYTEQLTTLIGVQSGIEELRKTPVWDKRPKNAFAKNVINDLLKGTNWQARFVGETTQRSTSFYYISVFEALKKVCKVWDLEMQFFVEMNGNKIGARYIDFKRKIGSAVGKRVVYGHNALQILQEVERTNLFTALIGRGKGEQVSSAEESDKKTDGYGRKITFENVVWDVAKGNPVNKPKGQRFVELPEMTKVYGIKNTDGSIRPKIGFVDFQEEEDPGVLLERTYKALVDTARPQLTLKTTSAYLRGVKVGDTIRVVRHDKKLDYDTRIFEITFNRLNNESSDIKLGDRIGESNEAKAQTIAEKVVDDFVSNEFSDFVQKLPDFLPSPDGFNNNWYGAEDPTVKHPGKVLVNDIWFKPDPEHEGHKIMLRWTGEVWDEIVRSYDTEAVLESIGGSFELFRENISNSVQALTDKALEKAGASSLLAQEAKRIGLDSVAKLEEFKRQATSAQTALSGDLDVLKQTIANDIRPKQEQVTAEIEKQVKALIQTKNELAGVKSAQATYEEMTTRRLAELTNLANGKASKSELTQTAEELASKIASVRVGGVNLFKGSKDFSGSWVNLGNWTRESEKYQGMTVMSRVGTWFGISQAFETQKGEVYTLSFYIKSSIDRDRINVYFTHASTNQLARTSPYMSSVAISNEWQRTSVTFEITESGFILPRIERFNTEAPVYVAGLKLERGNISTDYSEAPEDIEGQISIVESSFRQRADALDAGVSRLTEGLRTKADISSLNVTAENIRQSVKSLETDTQNKLNQMLSLAEFEVRASSIRQEILNATKDKADKTLVVAEAGKLRTELSTVQDYVNKDGQRQDALQRYTREESARQANAVRELISRDYVGKAIYQEDVKGLERRFSAISTQTNNDIATKIAQYKQTVDGQFANITSQIAGKANQTDFQRVKETSQLYERIIGNNDNSISNNIARIALTNQLFQVEVTKASASGRNLFLNSLFKRDLRKRYSTYDLFDGKDQTQGQLALSIDTNEKFKGANTLKIVSTFNGKPSNQKATFTIGGDARLGTIDEMRNKSVRFSFWAKSTVNNTILQARPGYRGSLQSVQISTDWKFYDIELVRKENSNATSELILHVFTAATVWIAFPKIEIGTVATPFTEAPEDTDEAIRTVQSQLAGSWGVHNKNSVNEIIAGFNLAGRNAGIKAETIRLEGNTLADKLTAIDGYFKRLFVGEGTFATLNADVIRTNSITADKLVMDMAMARRFVSSDIFTDTLAAKEAFINKLRSVVVTATLLEGFQGLIGGFRFGQYTNRNGYFITGTNSVSVGMGNGMNAGANRNAFWANWGESLDTPGPKAWYVNTDGKMYCRNEATFHSKVDFSSISNPNFYSKIKAHKGVWVGTDDVNGEGDNPAGGYNAVIWWSQIVTGKFRQHAGITTGSDRKLKENIEPTPVKALDKINALNLVAFDYIKDKTHEEIGLIAQEVLNIIPSSVEKYEDEDNHLTINYSKFVPYLIKAIQELNQKIEKMEKTIA